MTRVNLAPANRDIRSYRHNFLADEFICDRNVVEDWTPARQRPLFPVV